MANSYDLAKLDPFAFQHLVNSLAMRELGAGLTTFGPGPDGGRDGYFVGEAHAYPSSRQRWSGRWYIQSKFHAPHLSRDPQKWLIDQVRRELDEFKRPDGRREWPNNWIVATNVDVSGAPRTGALDQCMLLLRAANPELAQKFHVWGGSKILALLARHPDVAAHYGHFLTPGHILTRLYESLSEDRASAESVIRHLLVRELENQRYARLEQAGTTIDPPGIHELFIDLPCRPVAEPEQRVVATLLSASSRCQRPSIDTFVRKHSQRWSDWQQQAGRARTWFLRGGPGQGKSTIGQYFAQVQRAWFLLQPDAPPVTDRVLQLALQIRERAEALSLWPVSGRLPLVIELKNYTRWHSQHATRGLLTYLAEQIATAVEQPLPVGTLRKLLAQRAWFVCLDGLDEVPHSAKDAVAAEVRRFLDDVVLELDADVLALCTSRPQGYSGQYAELERCTVDLLPLNGEQALGCAAPLLRLRRSPADGERDVQRLTEAAEKPAVRDLMTTPLQSHIMAIVVREGGEPPDRRWKLFDRFYQVIHRREANRDLPDEDLRRVLQHEQQLLKSVHDRLGFALHAYAEQSAGARAEMPREQLRALVHGAVEIMKTEHVESTVRTIMEATTERLVLVNTPDDGDHVRFDVRQLQEFFAGEFLYDSVTAEELEQRIELAGPDSHWREAVHFLMSGLVESKRRTDLLVAIATLERIDNDDTQGDRALRRQLARGAAFVARLLAEGVLEQDRRIRDEIHSTLRPLFAVTQPRALEPLTRVRRSQSLRWLLEVLIEAVVRTRPGEHPGAMAVLAQILPDDDPRVETVVQRLREAPAEFVALVTRVTVELRTPQPWFARPAWELLTTSRFAELSPNTVRRLLPALHRIPSSLEEWFGADVAVTLGWLTRKWQWDDDHLETLPPRRGLRALHAAPKSAVALLQALWNLARDAPGAVETLDSVLAVLPEGILEALPNILGVEFPVSWWKDRPAQLTELAALSRTGARRQMVHLPDRREGEGRPRWRTFDDGPDVALLNWGRMGSLSQTDKVAALTTTLLQEPAALAAGPAVWGDLLRVSPRAAELRETLRQLGAVPRPTYSREFATFPLDLPADTPLLPHLVHSMLSGHDPRTPLDVPQDLYALAADHVHKFASIELLRATRDDETLPMASRLAASLFTVLHPDGLQLRESTPQLPANPPHWYVVSAVQVLKMLGRPGDPIARRRLSELTVALHDSYGDRDLLDPLYADWREVSLAPVTTAAVERSWLGLG